MIFNEDPLYLQRRLAETTGEIRRLEMAFTERGFDYSNLSTDYSGLDLEYYELDSEDDLQSELDVGVPFDDAELSDMPPLLEPAEALGGMNVISSFPQRATRKGKGKEVDNEIKDGEGKKLDKGKARDKGKGKARASPYFRDRPHLRMALQPLCSDSYLANIGGYPDEAMADLLTRFHTPPLFFPDFRFPGGDPSGCGVAHHDD